MKKLILIVALTAACGSNPTPTSSPRVAPEPVDREAYAGKYIDIFNSILETAIQTKSGLSEFSFTAVRQFVHGSISLAKEYKPGWEAEMLKNLDILTKILTDLEEQPFTEQFQALRSQK